MSCWRRATGARSSWQRSTRCRRVAFPAISTGIYGYPLERAAAVALAATRSALRDHPDVDEARFWLFDRRAYAVFVAALADLDG